MHDGTTTVPEQRGSEDGGAAMTAVGERADLMEALLGIAPGSPLAVLREARAAIRQHSQGAFEELVVPPDPGGLSAAERAALALRVALIERQDGLAAQYRALLGRVGTPAELAAAQRFPADASSDRFTLLLHFADLVAAEPEHCGQADIDELSAHGLSAQDIVAATQLVAFVPFQVRLLAGLRALQEEAAGTAASVAERAPVHPAAGVRFTMDTVGWEPRVPPVQAERATPAQLAALEACPPAQRRSTYFLTLANDPGSLGERGALFNGVMYAPRGLPRAERELATAVVSMVNGCIYCTSVHARRFAELTREPDDMQRLLDGGFEAPLDARRRAIVDFAARLTAEPGAVTGADLVPLRAAGLEDLELLDLIHSIAMFANANRLMQSLGRSVPPGA